MLVLSRKLNESIIIDGHIRITLLGIHGNQVRLGIEAPGRVGVYREELCLPGRAVEPFLRDVGTAGSRVSTRESVPLS